MKQLAWFVVFAMSSMASAEPFSAVFFEMESDKKVALMEYRRTEEVKGSNEVYVGIFKGLPSGAGLGLPVDTLVKEVVTMVNGQLLRYELDHIQTQSSGLVEIKEGKVHFSWRTGAETKSATEKLADNFVIGPTLIAHVKKHWNKIIDGGSVDIRYAALERKETVGFSLFRMSEEEINGKKIVVVKMKPSNFIIASLVKPLIFKFDKETVRLVELIGRTLPKKKKGNGWTDLDAHAVYSY